MPIFKFRGKTFEVFERFRNAESRVVSLRSFGKDKHLDISIDHIETGDRRSLISHISDVRKVFDVYERSSRLQLLLVIALFLGSFFLPSGLRGPIMTTVALFFTWKVWSFGARTVASNKEFEKEIESATPPV